jgi:DNA-binding NarL/FixJ family response regulator
MRPIRLFVADDHGLMVEAIRFALGREPDLVVVGHATMGDEVARSVARTRPDVVLLDIRLPDVDGLTVLGQLRKEHPSVKVVMLSGISDPAVEREALALGAAGYLGKGAELDSIAACIRRLASGGPSRRSSRAAGGPHDELSSREREILELVSRGRSNPEIAQALWVSEQTVKYHLTKIYRRLGVEGRAGAIRYAFEHGLCDDAQPAAHV